MEENAIKEPKKIKGLITGILIGLIIGAAIMFSLDFFVFNNTTVVKVKNGRVTEEDIYQSMKSYYVLSFALEEADKTILAKIYPETDELKAEAEELANQYIQTYLSYGYTQEKFLEGNGFDSYEKFVEAMLNNKRMELYYYDYIGKTIPEEDINNYYENNVYGDIDSKHILVKTSDTVTEEQANKLAKTIISELNAGATFDEEVEKYGDKITFEELGYKGFNSGLEESYMTALRGLEKDKYTTEPVKTSYGYHVIYCIDKAEKPSLEDSKENITKVLSKELEEADTNLYYKAMIQLRKDNNIKIKDKDLNKQYEEYCAQILTPKATDETTAQ